MTHKMRSTFVVSASTRAGVAIAGAILSATIISGGPAAAAEARAGAPSISAETPQLVYSPWAKFCGKGDPGARQVCFTGRDARTEAGKPVVSAALIEPEGEAKKLFRVIVSLPSMRQPRYGVHIIIDKEPAISSAFFTCFASGCTADYEASPELLDKLKKGQMLQIRVTDLAAAGLAFSLPLVDNSGNSFARANEGPPTDPKALKAQQKKPCNYLTLYGCVIAS